MLRIATWNVNGIRARHEEVAAWMQSEQPDVVCLQEIKAKADQVPATVCDLAGYWCYWHGSGGYSGVSLSIRKESFPERPEFSHPEFDNENRVVQARCGDLVLASIYLPNGGKDYEAKIAFMKAMRLYISSTIARGDRLIVCGDMNVALTDLDVHPKERKPNIIGQRPEERELFEGFLAEGVVDVGRKLAPEDDGLFTWWPYWRNMRQRNIGWRLDYVLASQKVAAAATACVVQREVGTSDHAPVMATFEL